MQKKCTVDCFGRAVCEEPFRQIQCLSDLSGGQSDVRLDKLSSVLVGEGEQCCRCRHQGGCKLCQPVEIRIALRAPLGLVGAVVGVVARIASVVLHLAIPLGLGKLDGCGTLEKPWPKLGNHAVMLSLALLEPFGRAAMSKIIPARKARQGTRGRHVLLVLLAALMLAMAAWGAAEFYGEMIDQDANQTTTAPG